MEEIKKLEDVEVVDLNPVEVVAIQSPVIRESSIQEIEFSVLGHVGMYDFEDTTLKAVKDVVREHIGVGFIFNSHGDNYHVYNPIIKSLQEIRERKALIDGDDTDHNLIGVEKNAYALRVSDKGSKPEPQFECFVKDSSINLKTKTFSKPHMEAIAERSNSDMAYNILNECKTVGDETKLVVYPTYENNHDADDLADAKDVIGDV